jgi:predicted helicase
VKNSHALARLCPPPPVVNFIVRAVNDILKESFGLTDGLADNRRVTVLDFACGTGTFLLEVFQRLFGQIRAGAQFARKINESWSHPLLC